MCSVVLSSTHLRSAGLQLLLCMANMINTSFSARWLIGADLQNRDFHVSTEVGGKIGTIPPKSGRLDTVCHRLMF